MWPVYVALALCGSILLFCTLYQTIWLLLSLPSLWRRAPLIDRQGHRTRFAVLIPAHNEEVLIAGTVRSLLASRYPAELLDLFAIADNCTDATAEIAEGAGARVLRREDPERRGKPYALAWAIGQIDLDRFDAFVIIDGDTEVDEDFLAAMATHVRRGEHAVQGYYGVLNPRENWITRLGVVPAVLKFRLHFPGKQLAGLSCPLGGNGMCFSREVIASFGWNAFSLTENWEYYINLTLHDYRVTAAPEAVIYAQVARTLKLGEAQRMRWMKGRMETLRRYGSRLLAASVGRGSLLAFDALIELARPSYSMLFIWSALYLAACALLAAAGLIENRWALLAVVLVAAQAVYVLAGVAASRQGLAIWLALAGVPLYLTWKAAVTFKGLLTIRDKTWVKTSRH